MITDDGRYHDNTIMRAQDALENAIAFAGSKSTAVGAIAETWLHDGHDAEFDTGGNFWGVVDEGDD